MRTAPTAVLLVLAAVFASAGCGPKGAPGYESVHPFEDEVAAYAGTWIRLDRKVLVMIEDWGDHCGPPPQDYASVKKQRVEVTTEGQHLLFSSSGLRTDRCMSPNPSVEQANSVYDSGAWSWACSTGQDDPKFESTEHQLTASDDQRLEYKATTHLDWPDPEGNCSAVLRETMLFVRESDTPPEECEKADPPAPE
jgi:hypothetical protein